MLRELLEQNENNPTITVQGFGTLDLDTAKKSAIARIEKALAKAKAGSDVGDWNNVQTILFDSGVLESMVKAITKNHPTD